VIDDDQSILRSMRERSRQPLDLIEPLERLDDKRHRHQAVSRTNTRSKFWFPENPFEPSRVECPWRRALARSIFDPIAAEAIIGPHSIMIEYSTFSARVP
jgi:hypothetical protein